MNSLVQDQRVSYELETDQRGKTSAVKLAERLNLFPPAPARGRRGRAIGAAPASRSAPWRDGSMSATQKFYRDRAAQARRDADAAGLDNVRDRHLRAAAAWDVMAARLLRTEKMRAETEVRKAAEREAGTRLGRSDARACSTSSASCRAGSDVPSTAVPISWRRQDRAGRDLPSAL